MRVYKVFLIFKLIVFPLILLAQEEKTFTFHSEEALISWQGVSNEIHLKGKVQITTPDYDIQSEDLWISGVSGENISGEGNILISNKDGTLFIQAQSFEYDKKKDILEVKGDGFLKDSSKETLLRANEITLERRDMILAEGAVRLSQKDVYAEGEILRYNLKTEILEILGYAKAIKKDENFSSQRIWLNLKTNQIFLEDDISGKVKINPDNIDKNSQSNS